MVKMPCVCRLACVPPFRVCTAGSRVYRLTQIAQQVALAEAHWLDGINFDWEAPARVRREGVVGRHD